MHSCPVHPYLCERCMLPDDSHWREEQVSETVGPARVATTVDDVLVCRSLLLHAQVDGLLELHGGKSLAQVAVHPLPVCKVDVEKVGVELLLVRELWACSHGPPVFLGDPESCENLSPSNNRPSGSIVCASGIMHTRVSSEHGNWPLSHPLLSCKGRLGPVAQKVQPTGVPEGNIAMPVRVCIDARERRGCIFTTNRPEPQSGEVTLPVGQLCSHPRMVE